jgi:hypothetical protein
MFAAFSTPFNRRRSFILLAACGVLAIAGAAVGIDDNLPGVALVYLSAITFVLAFAHPWRTARQFRDLFFASVLGFIAFATLHNLLEFLAGKAESDLLQSLLGAAGGFFFLAAILLCPSGVLVGGAGAVFLYFRQRHSQPGAPAA